MKKIFYFVFVLMIFSCNSPRKQDYKNCTKAELIMSQDIIPYFDSFINDCKKRNIKYDHAYCLNWMKLNHSHSVQGVTDFNDDTIEINEHLIEDSIGMKFVVYHELGHWFGLSHSSGIMKENYNSDDTQWVQENWENLKDEYFDKLKN